MYHSLTHNMKKTTLALALCCWSLSTTASTTESPTSSTTESDSGVFAAISFGGGFAQTSGINGNLDVNEDYDDFLFLGLELKAQWRGLFVELPGRSQEKIDGQFSGTSLGYNFYNTPNWSYDLYAVQSSQKNTYRLSSPNETLEFEREGDFRLGFRASGYFDDLFTQFIVTPHSFQDEIGGVEASASVRQNWQYRNWNIYNSIGVRYRSADIIDHFYGVDDALSAQIIQLASEDPNIDNLTEYFEPYEADGGLSLHGEVGFEYPISENMVFGGFFQYVVASDAAKDSPLFVGDRTGNAFGLSVTYVF